MPSVFSFDNNVGVGTPLKCNTPQDLCNVIKDELTFPYRDPKQMGVFQPINRQDGFKSLIFNTPAMFGASGIFDDTTNPSERFNRNGETVYNTMLPTDYGVKNGVSVVEMPLSYNGMPIGNQRRRTGFLKRDFDPLEDRFYITEDVVIMTTNNLSATQIPYAPTNSLDLVIPDYLSFLASDDETCGCSVVCCGDGWRELFAFDPLTNETEKMWMKTQPPVGEGGVNPYGKVTVQGREGYRFYVVRAVGHTAEANALSRMPTDYGSPIILRPGVEIKIGTVIGTSAAGCDPCVSPFSKVTDIQEFYNDSQKMYGSIMCIGENELVTNTYLQSPLLEKARFGMVNMIAQITSTLLYGQRGMFGGTGQKLGNAPTTNPVTTWQYNGTGSTTCDVVPSQTDGVFTLIDKYAPHLKFTVMEGCDNYCLLAEIKQLIEMISDGNYMNGNWALVGDDYLFELMRTMVNNRVNAVATREEAAGILFDNTAYNYVFPDKARGLFGGKMNPQLDPQMKYLEIGGSRIPFYLDLEMKKRHPGRMLLLKIDAIEFWYPNNSLLAGWNFRTPSAVPGTLLPNIFVPNIRPEMINGEMKLQAESNCTYNFNWQLEAGAWYEPAAIPNTFVLDFNGMKSNGTIVPIMEVACGCYASNSNIYNSLIKRNRY